MFRSPDGWRWSPHSQPSLSSSAASSASATVEPPVVNNNSLTVTSDAGGDTITLGVAGGFITVNGTATTLAADANAQIVVNAGGGNDTVDATGLGDELRHADDQRRRRRRPAHRGGQERRHRTATAGEDRLVGFKGVDRLDGGEGNDVLVWNNGDATDRDEGGAGDGRSRGQRRPDRGRQIHRQAQRR